jgi:hypothetical protein
MLPQDTVAAQPPLVPRSSILPSVVIQSDGAAWRVAACMLCRGVMLRQTHRRVTPKCRESTVPAEVIQPTAERSHAAAAPAPFVQPRQRRRRLPRPPPAEFFRY